MQAKSSEDVEEGKDKGRGKGKGSEDDFMGGREGTCDFLNSVPLPGNPGGSSETPSSTSAIEPSSLASGTSVSRKNKNKAKFAENDGAGGGGPEIVDVVVCCLSLMGINWVGGVYEACRILKTG